jgi:protein-L-isoaspartate(D-aspartate) O-methyltransferase
MTDLTDFDLARANMIKQQIRTWVTLDEDVVELLSVVRREDFVPLAQKALAFADFRIPLLQPAEEALQNGHCMLEPKIEARVLQELHLKPHDKVLEVGAGSGYMAALLAQRALRVISLELHPELVAIARTNLQRAGISNVEVRKADGAKGLAGEGPFDAIVLSGSVAEVPPVLLSQLKIGGRLSAIVGFEPVMRATLITRTGETTYTTTQPWDTVAPRLANFPEPSRFNF